MPPLRAGFKKRKAPNDTKTEIQETASTSSEGSDEDTPDLMKSLVIAEDDATDSEGHVSDSDGEQETVLFNSDNEQDEDDSADDNEVTEDSGEESEEVEDIEDSDEEREEEEGSDEESEDIEDSDDESGYELGSEAESDEARDTNKIQDGDEESGDAQTQSESSLDKIPPGNSKSKTQDTTDETKKTRLITLRNGKKINSIESKKNPIRKKARRRLKKTASDPDSNSNSENLALTAFKNEISRQENGDIGEKDEYASGDSSDEEDRRNTVGDIPMWWYNDYPHIGYNLDGKKLIKPPQRDQIEEFLKRCEDPDFWRTVRDPTTGQDVILSKEDLDLISRIKKGFAPNPEHDEYAPWVDWFSSEVLKTPVRAFPEHKRSFLPSIIDNKRISKMVHALKMGWMKTKKQLSRERKAQKKKTFYLLWGSHEDEENKTMRRIHAHIPAPRRPLPTHAESYNPPPEYLLDAKEMKEWNKLEKTPWKRKYTVLPQKYDSLRNVPSYDRYIRERFLRCLDLYLAPRGIKMRLTIGPQDLVPQLPSPRDLQPFPTMESVVFLGHSDMVRSIDVDPSGQYLLSGSEDATVKVWEVSTGRCLRTIGVGGPVRCVGWTPVAGLTLVAVAVDKCVLLLNPGEGIGDHKVAERTDQLLEEPPPSHEVTVDERTKTATQWENVSKEDWAKGIRIRINHFKEVKHLNWHARGDYLCVSLPDGASRSVLVHQLSKRRSQLPFSKAKGLVQCSLFHPVRPFLFVATQRVVRIYDLVKQELVKKLLTGAQWISCMAVHPAGDNLLVGSYDRKMMWFDLDMSSAPYQTLRLHGTAVRGVAFHKRYPLFASGGDDKKIIVSHGMVYNDLLQNPLIVPLKQLWGHAEYNEFGILDVKFHPYQPWVFSAGADKTIRLYT